MERHTLKRRPTTPPTGVPFITGTPRIGEQLSADITDIQDDDGITIASANFAYQWAHWDASTSTATDISGNAATRANYLTKQSDVGKHLVVTVHFTDDLSTREGPLRSDPTDSILSDDAIVKTRSGGTLSGGRLEAHVSKTAQGFTATASAGKYDLGYIDVSFDNIADTSNAAEELTATLNKDSSGEPGDILCTLTDPATFATSGAHRFHAPPGLQCSP